MADRPRVMVIAEAANPEWVSVPLVGWSLANALREVADVHLVSQVRNRDAILRAGLREDADFTTIDSEAIARPLNRVAEVLRMGKGKGWTMVTAVNALSYPYFEHLVWRKFGSDIRAGAYDIVHRVTPLSPTTVSPIAAKCARAGVPFVLGPLNGGVPWPPGFEAARRREREWMSYLRDAYKILPGRRKMYRNTAAVLAGSHHTASEIPSDCRDRTFWLPENAIDPARFNREAAPWQDGRPLAACFVGRLVPYKGLDMLLEAAQPYLAQGRLTLDVIGGGPEEERLVVQAQRLGIADTVTFHGMRDHHEVQDIMARTQLMAFPSIREFGGGVVLEAMALGVVPLVVDYAGPGELVDEEVGYKVPIGTRTQIIGALTRQLEDILADPETIARKSAAARKRISGHFTWQAKAAKVRRVYDWVLGATEDRPDLHAQMVRANEQGISHSGS